MRAALIIALLATAAWAADPFKDLGKNIDKGVQDAQKQLDKEKGKVDALSAEEQKCTEMANLPVGYEDELALGGAVAVNLALTKGLLIDQQKGKPTKDTPVNQLVRYVNSVGRVLAAVSPRSALEWKFAVLKDDQVNAWSAPGGYVFVTTGLLKRVKSEDQLAGVLAHEIAHVSLRHALNNYAVDVGAKCKTIYVAKPAEQVGKGLQSAAKEIDKSFIGELLKNNNVPELASATNVDFLQWATESFVELIVKRGVGQEAELAADRLATDMLIDAGYSVREFAAFLDGLPGGGVFSNHPPGAQRKAAVVAHAKARVPDDFTPPPHLDAHPLGAALQALSSIK